MVRIKSELKEYREWLSELAVIYYHQDFSHNTQIAKNQSLSQKKSEVSDEDK
jgi:hypothetical protein